MLALFLLTAPIVGGTASPQDRATVALVGPRGVYCSGVVIDATHVLTAAHCVPPNIDDAIEDLAVFFGGDITQGGARIAVAGGRAHPAWTPDAFGDDIGILELAEPAPVEPVAIGTGVPATGAALRAVGYGVASTSGAPGIRRAGAVIVEGVDELSIRLVPGGAVTCEGDSGGPLFAGDAVVGIHARSNCETLALSERVDVHAAFIAGDADEPGGDLAGGCRSTRGDASWALAAIVLWRRRRRGGVQ